MAEPATDWLNAAAPMAQPLGPLEERIVRLEAAVAGLQDTQALEDRVAERVTERLQAKMTTETERLVAAERRTSATAAAAMMTAAADKALRSVVAPVSSTLVRAPWLLIDLCAEAAAIFRMFFDLNYKVAWSTRLLTLLLLPAILTSQWWLPIPKLFGIGEVVDKLFNVVLAFVMFKALSREARRYLETRRS
jgi:hypothetical protein